MVSGDLDEYKIARLVEAGAPVDGFGVGTELITSRDAPALAMVYKLVELDGQGKFKLSPGKKTYPMAKQVFRRRDAAGRFSGDHVTRADETAEGEPLLVPILRAGRLVDPLPSLDEHPRPLPRSARRAAAAPAAAGRAARLSDHLQRCPRGRRPAADGESDHAEVESRPRRPPIDPGRSELDEVFANASAGRSRYDPGRLRAPSGEVGRSGKTSDRPAGRRGQHGPDRAGA